MNTRRHEGLPQAVDETPLRHQGVYVGSLLAADVGDAVIERKAAGLRSQEEALTSQILSLQESVWARSLALCERSAIRTALQDTNGALIDARRCLKAFPSEAQFLLRTAEALSAAGHPEKACIALDQLCARDHDSEVHQAAVRRTSLRIRPFDLVPAEIIVEILQHMHNDRCSLVRPLVAIQICASWRRLALATPSLWRDGRMFWTFDERAHPSRARFSMKALEFLAERSGHTLRQVDITLDVSQKKALSRALDLVSMSSMTLKALRLETHVSTQRSRGHARTDSPHDGDDGEASMPTLSIPQVLAHLSNSPKLEQLILPVHVERWPFRTPVISDQDRLSYRLPPQPRYLEFSGFLELVSIADSNFQTFLQGMTDKVETLRLRMLQTGRDPISAFDRLLRRRGPFLRSLSLDLRDGELLNASLVSSTSLPVLQQLEIKSLQNAPVSWHTRFLRNLDVPQLRDLTTTGHQILTMRHMHLRQLQEVTLLINTSTGWRQQDPDAVAVLARIPSVSRLRLRLLLPMPGLAATPGLVNCDVFQPYLEALTPSLGVRTLDRDAVLCPELTHLSVESVHTSGPFWRTAPAMLPRNRQSLEADWPRASSMARLVQERQRLNSGQRILVSHGVSNNGATGSNHRYGDASSSSRASPFTRTNTQQGKTRGNNGHDAQIERLQAKLDSLTCEAITEVRVQSCQFEEAAWAALRKVPGCHATCSPDAATMAQLPYQREDLKKRRIDRVYALD